MIERMMAPGEPRNAALADFCGSSLSRISGVAAADRWSCDNSGGYSYSPGQAQFWKACRAHDVCYWTPGQTRERCDELFRENLKSECEAAFPPTNPVGIIAPWLLNTFGGVQAREFGHCRLQCSAMAASYGIAVERSSLAGQSFAEAQAESREVETILAAALEHDRILTPGDRLAPLIGEACVRHAVAGKCEPEAAANWVSKRLPGTEVKLP